MKKIISYTKLPDVFDSLSLDFMDDLLGESDLYSLEESVLKTLSRDEYTITLPHSGGGGGISVIIDTSFFLKFEYEFKEFYGSKYLRLSGENVPETALVSLPRESVSRMINKKDIIKRKSIYVWEFLNSPSEKFLKILALPFVKGKDFTEIEASFFTQENIRFLGRELGRIIIKDMVFGVRDRMIGRTNPGNVMISQNEEGLLTSCRLILIDNVFDVSKRAKKAYLVEQVKNFIKVASSNAGARDMAPMPDNIDFIIAEGISEGANEIRTFFAQVDSGDIHISPNQEELEIFNSIKDTFDKSFKK